MPVGAGFDRRDFFSEFLREAVGVVREANAAVRSAFEEEPLGESEPWYEARPVPGRPAARTVSREALIRLCDEVGLGARRKLVLDLARASLRLTRVAEPRQVAGRSHLGGVPDLPADFVWPTWRGKELGFLGQLDLAEVAALAPETALPGSGLLLFFYALSSQPSGLAPGHCGSCRVLHIDLEAAALTPDPERRVSLHHYPLELSQELMLCRSWSAQVERLDLNLDELSAWDTLRERLAQAQGVELEEQAPNWQALHRLLGYGEELGSEMELDCELVASGISVENGAAYSHPRREELRAAAREWGLLLQLSADDELGTSLGDGFGRLYFLIRRRDLQTRSFDSTSAILR
jgi:uncharacterized protein YwqG